MWWCGVWGAGVWGVGRGCWADESGWKAGAYGVEEGCTCGNYLCFYTCVVVVVVVF